MALDVLEGDLPVRKRRSVGSLGPVGQREVLARAEGPRDNVGRVRGVEIDADPWPWPDVALG
eukprot:6617587-Alexandrium_andersonii.AAC.1